MNHNQENDQKNRPHDLLDESRNPELYNKMGGQLKSEVYDKARSRASNACALKLCIALEKAGFYIPDRTKSLQTSTTHNNNKVEAEVNIG